MAAVAVAWLSLKQHSSLSSAYAIAARELNLVHEQVRTAQTEAEWALRVNDAEEAISREHTMWRASRTATS